MATHSTLHFVSSENLMTPEMERQMLKTQISDLKSQIDRLEAGLKTEIQKRGETDMIIASQVANIKNLLREKGVIEKDRERIDDTNSILYNCQICFKIPYEVRFLPCKHVVSCDACVQVLLAKISQQRKCPICKIPLYRADRVWGVSFHEETSTTSDE